MVYINLKKYLILLGIEGKCCLVFRGGVGLVFRNRGNVGGRNFGGGGVGVRRSLCSLVRFICF